jgi:hypothetical protein
VGKQNKLLNRIRVVDSTMLKDPVTGVEFGGTGVTVLDRMSTPVTVGNTTTETTIYSYADPGGQLDVDRLMRLTLAGTITDSALDTVTALVLRFKYGATTLIARTLTTDDGATTIGATIFRLVFELWATGTTSSQTGILSGTLPTLIDVATNILNRGTSAIDSESAQTLAVTADWNNAAAAATMTLNSAVLELL